MNLERIDKAMLKTLQKDGRISNSDLADTIGASTSACWNRMNRLVDEGYIRSFKAVLNADKLELSLLVLIGVVLDRSTPESFSAFEKAAKKIPVVQECLLIAGEFDYWLKIRVKDIHSFNQLHATVLLHLPGVRQLRSFFVLNEVKHDQELFIEL
jgi:Lrp/AsnC family leucine-responsive transcriptional regulator